MLLSLLSGLTNMALIYFYLSLFYLSVLYLLTLRPYLQVALGGFINYRFAPACFLTQALLLFSENYHTGLGQVSQTNSFDSFKMESTAGGSHSAKLEFLNMKVETIMNSH